MSPQAARARAAAWAPFPTVDVPDHAHYVLGTVILLVGLTGMLGNLMVIYTFCRCLVGGAGVGTEGSQPCGASSARTLLSRRGDGTAKPLELSGRASVF